MQTLLVFLMLSFFLIELYGLLPVIVFCVIIIYFNTNLADYVCLSNH